MRRQIIKIDEEKCNGCGLCVSACHEGAIRMVNGKAKLLRDDYCDGLGNCLPVCPAGAISFEEREAKPFDAETVKERMKRTMNMKIDEEDVKKRFDAKDPEKETNSPCGCPGAASKSIISQDAGNQNRQRDNELEKRETFSRLKQWPVQIKLAPVNAPYFENADLLIAADCSAFACGDFHDRYMKGKITLAGCPKLDGVDYTEKLAAIIGANNIKSVTVVRMEVPCCAGIVFSAREAVKLSGKNIKTETAVLSLDGKKI